MSEFADVNEFLLIHGLREPDHIFSYLAFGRYYGAKPNPDIPLHTEYFGRENGTVGNYALLNAATPVEAIYVGASMWIRTRLIAHHGPNHLFGRWRAAYGSCFQPTVAVWIAGKDDDIELMEQWMIDVLRPVYNKTRRPLAHCSFRSDTEYWRRIERERIRSMRAPPLASSRRCDLSPAIPSEKPTQPFVCDS